MNRIKSFDKTFKVGYTKFLDPETIDVFGVEIETGTVLWSFPWDTPYDVNAADPLPVGGGFFISTRYSWIYLIYCSTPDDHQVAFDQIVQFLIGDNAF